MPGKVTGVSFNDTHSYDDWGLKLKMSRLTCQKQRRFTLMFLA